ATATCCRRSPRGSSAARRPGAESARPSAARSVPSSSPSSIAIMLNGVVGLCLLIGGARCGALVFVQSARHRDYFLPKVTSDYGEEPAPPSAVWRRNRGERRHAARIAPGRRPAGRNPVGERDPHGRPAGLLPPGSSSPRCALAGKRRGRESRTRKSCPGEPRSRAGFRACVHRLDLSRRRRRFAVSRRGADARPRRRGLSASALDLFVSTLTLATGRATILRGAVHLVIFGAFLLLAAIP